MPNFSPQSGKIRNIYINSEFDLNLNQSLAVGGRATKKTGAGAVSIT